jgi:hypothetical protein
MEFVLRGQENNLFYVYKLLVKQRGLLPLIG